MYSYRERKINSFFVLWFRNHLWWSEKNSWENLCGLDSDRVTCSTWSSFLHLGPLYLTSFPHFFSVSMRTSTSLSDSIQTSFLGRSISNFTSPSLLRTLVTAPEHPSHVIATSNSCLVMLKWCGATLLSDQCGLLPLTNLQTLQVTVKTTWLAWS